MAQIPEFSQLTPGAQALVTNGGMSFELATLVDRQTTSPSVPVQAHEVHAVDHRMGRSPGPGQLTQFTALPAVAQQHVVDRGFTFAMAKAIEDEIAASANPVVARQKRWNSD